MVKKKKFPFLFKGAATTTTSAVGSPWPCPNNPKTLSFRANANTNIYKTINSAYLDDDESAVIRGLRSDRLFFDPGETSSSILEEAETAKAKAFPHSIMAMDSNDPFLDFRSSRRTCKRDCRSRRGVMVIARRWSGVELERENKIHLKR